jgi:class 3 adenylate cyclase
MNQHGSGAKAGIHTGEIERHEQDIRGFAIDLARHLAQLATPGQVLVSRTVRDLTIGSELQFVDHGPQHLEQLGDWELFTPSRPIRPPQPRTPSRPSKTDRVVR